MKVVSGGKGSVVECSFSGICLMLFSKSDWAMGWGRKPQNKLSNSSHHIKCINCQHISFVESTNLDFAVQISSVVSDYL